MKELEQKLKEAQESLLNAEVIFAPKWREFKENFKILLEKTESFFSNLEKTIESASKHMDKNKEDIDFFQNYKMELQAINNLGWVSLSRWSSEDLFSILDDIKNGKDSEKDILVNSIFITHIESEYVDICEEIKSTLTEKDWLLNLFEETEMVIEMGLFDTAVNNLLILIEGLLSEIHQDKSKTKFVGELTSHFQILEETKTISGLKKYVTLFNLKNKVEKIFSKSDFNNKDLEPSDTNRHWKLHGRSETFCTKEDVFKLIATLENLSYISVEYRNNFLIYIEAVRKFNKKREDRIKEMNIGQISKSL